MRLAVIVSHPIQYHSVLWKALANDKAFSVTVFFCSDFGVKEYYDAEFDRFIKWDRDLLQGYDYIFSRNRGFCSGKISFFRFFNLSIIRAIASQDYDAVYFHGHYHLTHLLSLITAKLTRKRIVMRNIANNLGERSTFKAFMRNLFCRALYGMCDAFLYIGKYNYDYYRSFGVPKHKIYYAPHIVDNDYFQIKYRELYPKSSRIKEKFGLDKAQRVVLFCGKFIPIKAPLIVIQAFIEANLGPDWALLMVGDGPLRSELEAVAAAQSQSSIIFTGFMNQSQLPEIYTVSDIIVLFTQYRETWGLVINEALNFECAAIVSDRVACGPELVEGKTGEIIPHDNPSALAESLWRLANSPEKLAAYQKYGTELINKWNKERFLEGLKESIFT